VESRTFSDFDAFAATVRDANTVMMLQTLTQSRWSVSHVNVSGLHVQLGREGSGNITEGEARDDGYLLFLPLNHHGQHAANGTALDNRSIAILEPGSEFCLRCRAEHDWISIFIPTDKLAGSGHAPAHSPGIEHASCRVTQANPSLANEMRALAGQIMTAAASCSRFESSPAAKDAEAALLNLCSNAIEAPGSGGAHRLGRPRVSRKAILRRCKTLLQEHNGEPVSVQDLAVASGVTERTVRHVFHEHFGVGPHRYLQIRRLHQVYRALIDAESGSTTVTTVLLQHGEWNLSRFAARYHRVFGERPSETLRQKSGTRRAEKKGGYRLSR
jgi:AraC family ethanolamine operon transcriptional activator